jgi:predicted amidophosphoribosyltransferase
MSTPEITACPHCGASMRSSSRVCSRCHLPREVKASIDFGLRRHTPKSPDVQDEPRPEVEDLEVE